MRQIDDNMWKRITEANSKENIIYVLKDPIFKRTEKDLKIGIVFGVANI